MVKCLILFLTLGIYGSAIYGNLITYGFDLPNFLLGIFTIPIIIIIINTIWE